MKTPWHLWVIGAVTLLWNSGGAFDYYMTQSADETYLSAFTPEQLAYFQGFPVWVDAAWAVGVWLALIGSFLLLFRSRHAVTAFALSFLGMVATSVYGFFLSGVSLAELMGPGMLWFTAAILVVGLLLVIYARAMRGRGVLR